jgi:Alpha-glucosidases, family 31 of glycosyl hydrolases
MGHGEYYASIIRKYMNLRYELLPYLYNLVYESSTRGYPIIRPLFFEFQNDENTYTIEDEFMIGPHLLIAPILKEGAEKRIVYLPEGGWFDYWSKQPIKGKQWINYEAPLDKLPIFIRGGTIIPKQKVLQYTDQEEIKEIILEVYPSKHDIRYSLYDDDGISLNSPYSITEFSCERKRKEVIFNIDRIDGDYGGAEKFLLRIYGTKPNKGLLIDGKTKRGKFKDGCLTLTIAGGSKKDRKPKDNSSQKE